MPFSELLRLLADKQKAERGSTMLRSQYRAKKNAADAALADDSELCAHSVHNEMSLETELLDRPYTHSVDFRNGRTACEYPMRGIGIHVDNLLSGFGE